MIASFVRVGVNTFRESEVVDFDPPFWCLRHNQDILRILVLP
jgi:hypothetical protein